MHVVCNRVRNGYSRSSKVVDFGSNRKGEFTNSYRIRDSNFGFVLRHFWDIAGFLRKLPPAPIPAKNRGYPQHHIDQALQCIKSICLLMSSSALCTAFYKCDYHYHYYYYYYYYYYRHTCRTIYVSTFPIARLWQSCIWNLCGMKRGSRGIFHVYYFLPLKTINFYFRHFLNGQAQEWYQHRWPWTTLNPKNRGF